jgi:hypothetical protein
MRSSELPHAASSNGQKVVELPLQLGVADVLRMMGCRKAENIREEVRGLAGKMLNEARPLLKPLCAYVVRDVVSMTDTEISLAGCPTIHGPIAGFLKPSTRVATFVLTVGAALEKRATECMHGGDMLEGYTWHSIASAAADLAVDTLTQHLLQHEAGPDEAITPPFSPGYCGMDITEQRNVFSIVDSTPVGVRLLPTCMMEPVKSISGLMGIGPRDEVVENGVPCQWCNLTDCAMRR